MNKADSSNESSSQSESEDHRGGSQKTEQFQNKFLTRKALIDKALAGLKKLKKKNDRVDNNLVKGLQNDLDWSAVASTELVYDYMTDLANSRGDTIANQLHFGDITNESFFDMVAQYFAEQY